uniref:Ig-like domain-containing protein n=1 Tax=Branchiostoma floridae TaxID=7739 RepID=C3YL22_BRAFL|eukprot:XP_002603001.1 hypothetical protein BRAFLDRAFT_84736 [Branchiostoma floridae]
MVGITGTTYRALCPIILLWIGSASALRRAICPPGKDGPYSRPKILYPKLSNMCKTTLTCEVACVDCCPCDTGLCEMVLLKDNRVIASKETSVSPDGTVQASFSLKRTLEVYGEYQCVIRPTHHGCKNQSWSESSNMLIFESPTVLQPHTVPSWMRTTTKHGCAFLIEHREVDRYAIVVTSQGNELLRPDVEVIPVEDDGAAIVTAIFEIEVKDPTSFGIYDCILEKDGLRDPSAIDITANSTYFDRGLYFHNTFQITPSTIWRPLGLNRLQIKLGTLMYLPCHSPKDILTTTDEVSQLSWYRNGVQIRDDDNFATLISQRFWDGKQLVPFLWCNVNADNLEAFGTYECRSKDDGDLDVEEVVVEDEVEVLVKDSYGSVPTDSLERDDLVLRQRENILSDGTD